MAIKIESTRCVALGAMERRRREIRPISRYRIGPFSGRYANFANPVRFAASAGSIEKQLPWLMSGYREVVLEASSCLP
jgi:hypothetical protein